MKQIQILWDEIIKNDSLIDALFSNVRRKSETPYSKINIRPVLIKNQPHYQFEYIFPTKVTHENIPKEDFIKYAWNDAWR